MSLSDKAVQEYRDLYKKEFGKEISMEEARTQGERLLAIFKPIFKAIPVTNLACKTGGETNNAKTIV